MQHLRSLPIGLRLAIGCSVTGLALMVGTRLAVGYPTASTNEHPLVMAGWFMFALPFLTVTIALIIHSCKR